MARTGTAPCPMCGHPIHVTYVQVLDRDEDGVDAWTWHGNHCGWGQTPLADTVVEDPADLDAAAAEAEEVSPRIRITSLSELERAEAWTVEAIDKLRRRERGE
jgi:hypothetical protein